MGMGEPQTCICSSQHITKMLHCFWNAANCFLRPCAKSVDYNTESFQIFDGTKRFGELKKSVVNISRKVLTANLRSMEGNGLLTRKVYLEVPPRVEYTLTETGYSLKSVLDAMVEWGMECKRKINVLLSANKTLQKLLTSFIGNVIL